MAFSSNFKIVEQNRRLQTKNRERYRDMLGTMESSNPLQYNEEFTKDISKQQLEKIRSGVRQEIWAERVKQYLFTALVVFSVTFIVWYIFFH